MNYDFAAIEKKWQDNWEKTKPYAAVTGDTTRPKFYGLIEFPYPSAAGLHVGHPRPFTAIDIVTRKKRMEGYNVLFPIGYDAFGLPTENYAIKNHIHPAVVTKNNIQNFTNQLKMLGYGFDWDRCVDTTDPQYYKWTQWIFLQLFKHGLAYKATMPVNWCTSCKCVLANEEVVEGVCERCGSVVIRKEKSQWMLGITKYADRLIDDLDGVDFVERVKTQLRAAQIYSQDSAHGRAYEYGQGLSVGLGIEDVNDWPAILDAVTPDDIRAAAKLVLENPATVTGWLMPADPGTAEAGARPASADAMPVPANSGETE